MTPLSRAAASLIAACCAAAAVLAISGCGASNAIDPVARAADLSSASPGYRIVLDMQVSMPSLSQPISATGTGSFTPAAHTGSFALAIDTAGVPSLGTGSLRLQEVIKGTAVYVKIPAALASRLPGAGARPWLKLDLSNALGSSALSSLGANPLSGDPGQLLAYLRASGGVTKVGTEQVAGYATTHYTGHVNLDQVAARVPSAQRAAVQSAISQLQAEGIAGQIPIDAWIDGHGFVREMAMHLKASPAGQTVSTAIRILIPQYGPQPAPTVPPASQVTDASGLLGAG